MYYYCTNCTGISLGDGMYDPISQIPGYGDLLFNLGLIDLNQAQHFRDAETKIVQLIQQEQYVEAFGIFDELLNGDF
jgi:hypothetical protein